MAKDQLVLLFGEDENDTRARAQLCYALAPDKNFDAKVIKRPPVLSRDAALRKRQSMAETMSAFADGLSKGRKKVVVVAHRDCDAVEPAHRLSAQELEADLLAADIKYGVAATPAWELETWWMVFPAAVSTVRGCWRKIDYGTQAVGSIANAKERLTRDLRPVGANRGRCPDYTESDGALIAEAVRRLGIDRALKGRLPASMAAFQQRFVEQLEA